MNTALIGHTGFVGGNLLAQGAYSHLYRSTDIDGIRGKRFDHVVCAGVQAMKWWANLHPEEDKAGIERLRSALAEVGADRFTLISTIDIYPSPRGVDEDSAVEREGHHAYGLHRLEMEDWVRNRFPHTVTLRLPGLFGPGLKKNVIYDMLHHNNLDKVHPGGVFQYYDLQHLTRDIQRAWDHGIDVLNISCEPLATGDIRDTFFPGLELGATGPAPAGYDMLSKHADLWDGANGYLYRKDRVMADLREFVQAAQGRTHTVPN